MDKDLKKYGLITGAGLILGIATYGFIKWKQRQKVKKDTYGYEHGGASITDPKTGKQINLGINIYSIAKQIGIDLGTAYPAYDPRSWTENDDAVLKLVLKVPKNFINQLISDYRKIYNRSLTNDLQTKLDNWKEVEYLFV